MRMLFAAMLIASSSLALAQSATSTDFTTQPTSTAPTTAAPQSVTQPNGQKKVVMPPAARAGERGLRVGEGAVTGEPIEIKRQK